MEPTTLYLERDQKKALRQLAFTRTERADKRVTMADLVREAVDLFLARELRETQQNAEKDSAVLNLA
jgi:hypothetical protein